ncbi:MAG: hypothetical protein L0287_15135, partial [Anaerolineae bacterium]|nr:hypothetical protein [Anaerolineae bacterium]
MSAERGAGYIPLLGAWKEDPVSQTILNQIRRYKARKQPIHPRGDDCWSAYQGRMLGLTRSAEQRDEAERAGASVRPRKIFRAWQITYRSCGKNDQPRAVRLSRAP